MWRRFAQHFFGPKVKDKHRAFRTRQRFSMLYAFIGWNCFGVTFYLFLKDKMPTDSVERRKSYRLLTGVPDNVHVYQIQGLKLTNEFDITYNDKKEEETGEIEKATAKADEH
ncbi:unnamed protein product [Lasius platythorax]|uniref:Uncharacterized protein n=1 Tax=Lasius platythorax TaxID=488582 RepID=A0AAV2P621_9HYME